MTFKFFIGLFCLNTLVLNSVFAASKASSETRSSQRQEVEQTDSTRVQIAKGKGGGAVGTGGGNGKLLRNGNVIPLDLYIAQNLKSLTITKDFPEAYRYFQSQVQKIRNVIPAWADDIEKNFSEIEWIGTELGLNAPACLNHVGIFQVDINGSQVVLACQSTRNRVTIDMKLVRRIQPKEYMGVVFFHEAVVNQLLRFNMSESTYREKERLFLTEWHPYLLNQRDLDVERLLFIAQNLRFVEMSDCNPYFEAVPKIRESCEQYRAEIEAQKKDKAEAIYLVERYHNAVRPFLGCDTGKLRNEPKDLEKIFEKLSGLWMAASQKYNELIVKWEDKVGDTTSLELKNWLRHEQYLFQTEIQRLSDRYFEDVKRVEICFGKLMAAGNQN